MKKVKVDETIDTTYQAFFDACIKECKKQKAVSVWAVTVVLTDLNVPIKVANAIAGDVCLNL